MGECYVSNLLPKTLVLDWKSWLGTSVLDVFLGSPLLGPKKLQNQQFYISDWIRKKLLFHVANLATCCHDDYDVLLEVLGSLRECYVSPDWQHRQEFFSLFNLLYKIVDFEAFWGPVKSEPQEDIQEHLCQSWFSIQNQSLGNRIANIAFAHGSQNSNSTS